MAEDKQIVPLTGRERETHINIPAYNRRIAIIGTDDPVFLRKLDKWFQRTETRNADTPNEWAEYRVPVAMAVRVSLWLKGNTRLRSEAPLAPAPLEPGDDYDEEAEGPTTFTP